MIIVFLILFSFTLMGCQKLFPSESADIQELDTKKQYENESQMQTLDPLETTESDETTVLEETTFASDDMNQVSPYNFLFYQCGNSEYLQFSYQAIGENTNPIDFYMFDGKIASYFYQPNMNNDLVFIREIESDGLVNYILDNTQQVKTYLSPASDFLFDLLLRIVSTDPLEIIETDNGTVYKYIIPSDDKDFNISYELIMNNQVLTEYKQYNNDSEVIHFIFSHFSTEPFELSVFEMPSDYTQEYFDYSYQGDFMPPWWDANND